MLHDADDGAPSAPRRQPQGTGGDREDGDSEGSREVTGELRYRGELFGGTRLQVNGTHVLRSRSGQFTHLFRED